MINNKGSVLLLLISLNGKHKVANFYLWACMQAKFEHYECLLDLLSRHVCISKL